ncbi:hypothetical protein V2J09_022408 [Rumex salicifolius]
MSSETSLRLRSPASTRRSSRRLSRPSSPSPHPKSPTSTPRKLPFLSEPIDILPKCSSEPFLFGGHSGSPSSVSDGWLYSQMTCTDVLSPSSTLLSPARIQSPSEVYQKDTKVVVTVTVEGSPGPIRTMVKLGTTVDETIQLLIDKYDKEGRFPRLDKNAASVYELHLSYFSLESLERSDSIGDVGSRNFYLRKGRPSHKTIIKASEIVAQAEVHTTPDYESRPWVSMSVVFFPAYITRKTTKIVRRMRRLWKVLGCLHCSA